MRQITDDIADVRAYLAALKVACPECLLAEEEGEEPISEGCVTKGDARQGTLEIYGCARCGGGGGGLEADANLRGHPDGVASWNERMQRVGAKYGAGKVLQFPALSRSCEENPWCDEGRDPLARDPDGVCHFCTDGRVEAFSVFGLLLGLRQMGVDVEFDDSVRVYKSVAGVSQGATAWAWQTEAELIDALTRALAAAEKARETA